MDYLFLYCPRIFMSEKIYFCNSKGDKLCGILSNPNNNSDKPIVILCHGFTVSKDSSSNIKLEEIMNKEGIATLKIDLFAHGESEGNFEEITVSEAVDDIMQAVNYVQQQGFERIGLVGESFSGIASTIVASKIDTLSLLVLISPVSDYEEVWKWRRSDDEMELWKQNGHDFYTNSRGERRKLNYSFVEDFRNYDAYELAKNIKIPTLIVHGDADKTVPLEQSKKIAAIIPHCALEIIKDADHTYSDGEHFNKMIDKASQFIIKHIYG